MKNNKNNFNAFISITFLYFNIISCQLLTIDQKGKCLYIATDSGSEIYNFHKYSNKQINTSNFEPLPELDISNWAINLCNDTRNPCFSNNRSNYNSQIFYYNKTINNTINDNNCIRLTGGWYKSPNDTGTGQMIYNKINDTEQFIFRPTFGDFCDNKNYSTNITFEGDNNIKNNLALITKLPDISNCNTEIIIKVNLDYTKDYLVLPKIFNDYGIFSGIIFVLIGIYLCFLADKFENTTKYIIYIIFSELFTFIFEMFIINSKMKYLEIILLSTGLIIGIILCLLSRKIKKNIFHIFLAANSGFISGLFVFDILFLYGNFFFIKTMLMDTVISFIISAIITIHTFPNYNIYFNSFIGGYILIRGISILVFKIFGSFGYRDLQLLIYLIDNYETESANYYLTNVYNCFWFYDICISCFIIVSILYYKFDSKNNKDKLLDDEEDEEDKEDKKDKEEDENQKRGEDLINN